MEPTPQAVKMMPVDSDLFEAVGYIPRNRQLYIKFRNSPALCFDNVPGFRYESLLSAPRKDAYYRTFIKDRFLTKPVQLPTPT
ncbi:MAG TPA: KTSC domain-containing protein [Candidatus Sulfopaludibacter sp.]|nr:KTSC domain-containing protein [Candidatus Sulfopaludibacter sp.]